MTQEPRAEGETDDQDRVVSRRVERATEAEPGDEAVYQAADPAPDDGAAATTGSTEGTPGASAAEAAEEMAEENESEPGRSE